MTGKLRRVAETSRCKAGCRKQICVLLFEGDLVHRFVAPLEESGLRVVDLDEIGGLADLTQVCEAGAVQDGPCHDAEPSLDLIESTGVRGCVVELDVGMPPEPAVAWLSLAEGAGRSAL